MARFAMLTVPWALTLGVLVGSLATFVIFVIWMAPKHWEQWHQLKAAKERCRVLTDEVAHYKALTGPRVWGSPAEAVAERELIALKAQPPYEELQPSASPGAPIVHIDDIADKTEWLGQ